MIVILLLLSFRLSPQWDEDGRDVRLLVAEIELDLQSRAALKQEELDCRRLAADLRAEARTAPTDRAAALIREANAAVQEALRIDQYLRGLR